MVTSRKGAAMMAATANVRTKRSPVRDAIIAQLATGASVEQVASSRGLQASTVYVNLHRARVEHRKTGRYDAELRIVGLDRLQVPLPTTCTHKAVRPFSGIDGSGIMEVCVTCGMVADCGVM